MSLDTNSTICGTGANSNIESQVDPSFQAIRVNLRPTEFTNNGLIGGHYFMAANFNNTAGQPATTSQPLFALRWADSRMLFILKRVAVTATIKTAFGAAQVIDYDIIKTNSFNTNPTGGNSISLASTAQKARTATMSGSLLGLEGAIQISSGSPLAIPSGIMDTQPFGYVISALQTAATAAFSIVTPSYQSLYELRDFGQHPMIFGPNEGFIIRNGDAYGATGVVKTGFVIEWMEAPSY